MGNTSIPTAAVVVVGNEVLSAKVQDENTPFLLERFRRLGVPVTGVHVVPDSLEPLSRTYRRVCSEATWVISTGGVGPTHDDVTMEAVARAFGRSLETNAELERLIRDFFGDRLNEFHLKMADLPEGAELTWGTQLKLPVVRVENLYVLPGSPGLVRSKFLGIEGTFCQQPFHLRRLSLKVDEAEIAALLARTEARFTGVAIGSYPVVGTFDHSVEVTVEGKEEERVQAATDEIRAGLPADALVQVA